MLASARRRASAWFAITALIAGVFVAAAALGMAAPSTASASNSTSWSGGVDLYRPGVYTVQQTWIWCTAADVQIIRNITAVEADHSKSAQRAYFDYMRAHNRYAIPVRDGVDPAGWAAGLRQFVDSRYQLYASRSFDSALRSAVTNLRVTNLPVAITVAHGNHAWILTGFTATADPAATTDFAVTSVRVTGPLWGLQSRTYGLDMKPDTQLTPRQLETFFTPWRYTSVPMVWEATWVSIQPVADAAQASAAARVVPAPSQGGVARLQPVSPDGPPAAAASVPAVAIPSVPVSAVTFLGLTLSGRDAATSVAVIALMLAGAWLYRRRRSEAARRTRSRSREP